MIPGLVCATCNMMTGRGFGTALMGSWSKVFIGLLILFFIIALLKRWLFESIDLPYNLIIGEAAGIITYIIITNLLCSFKIALVVGLGAGVVLGWLGSSLIGGGGD